MPDDASKFSHKDVRLILQKAAELQSTQQESAHGRLDISDIEQIAAEAGIDASNVRRAALLLREQNAPASSTLFEADITLPREVDDAFVDYVITEVRIAANDAGVLMHEAGSSAWHWVDSNAELNLTVARMDGATRIRIAQDRTSDRVLLVLASSAGGFLLSLFGGAVLGALTGLGETGAMTAILLGSGGAGVAGGAFAGLAWWRRISSRWRSRLEQLRGRITQSLP